MLAVEMKRTSRPISFDEAACTVCGVTGLSMPCGPARRTRNLLAAWGDERDVIPVLVLWGRGVPHIPGGYRLVGQVRVLVGAQAEEWRQRLGRLPTGAPAAGAKKGIQEYVRRYERARTVSRPPTGQGAVVATMTGGRSVAPITPEPPGLARGDTPDYSE